MIRKRFTLGLLACTLLLHAVTAGSAAAQKGRHLEALSWDRNIAGMMREFCYRCHGNDQPSGGVNLAQDVNPRMILDSRETWETALMLLEAGEMPPSDAKQPDAEKRALMIEFLSITLENLDCTQQQDPGPPPFRRLNHVEYNNTIAALTGLDLRPADHFSPDPSSFGFDSIGEALMLSPVQVEQYHQAARDITAAILQDDPHANSQSRHPLALMLAPEPSGDETETAPREVARQAISQFTTRAFRGPVEPEYIDRLMAIYDLAIARGDQPPQSVGHMITAVLISPRFLMRWETSHPDRTDPYPVSDHELAVRLSYFLWSGPPDEPLLALAAAGKLADSQVLEQQTRRMLADSRSQALVDNFFGQWLELRRLDSHALDEQVFPDVTPSLRSAIATETRQLLTEMVQQNRPIWELIDADYTYLNQELAQWYGIDGVEGDAFRRVALQDRRRGGLLTTAAVLMLQSDPDRTNIPRRGNYIAARILGDAPPPPPADVPELSAAAGDKVLTLRERLELHRQNAECAGCHARIDPFGFSLENYDAAGRWRELDAGQPIDPSGTLLSGQNLSGPLELKDILLERRDAFSRTLSRNLLIYALGRRLQADDECVIRDAIAVAQDSEGRFGELVVSIVQSYPFRYRRNAEY